MDATTRAAHRAALLVALAAVPPGWPFPFPPVAAAVLLAAVVYAASTLRTP